MILLHHIVEIAHLPNTDGSPMLGTYHYTFLENVDCPMSFHSIDELMKPLVTLPD